MLIPMIITISMKAAPHARLFQFGKGEVAK
jgi:hypothetical protein